MMRRQIPEINQLILLLIKLIGRLIRSWLSRQAALALADGRAASAGHVVVRQHKDFKLVSFKQTPLPPDQVPFRQISAQSRVSQDPARPPRPVGRLNEQPRSEVTPSSLISSTISLWFRAEEARGRYVFLLVTASQTGRAKEAGREGRNRKAEVFS